MIDKFLLWLDNVPLIKAPLYFLLLVGLILLILTIVL
tara:strand:+ start:741 stop:851 length:111 start_codon:yes stop_codon:yes gene_type:complete